MSTLFGIFNRNERVIQSGIIQSMREPISHRSFDKVNVWQDAYIALDHHMTYNTPESKHEHIPLQKDTCVLAIDARIDNRSELFAKLVLPDRPLEEIGDSEFVLAAYLKWGSECPKYLLGDFVFAIWDAAKKELFCARDHIGIKPFYYYLDDEIFVCSNEIHVLLAHPAVPQNYNDKSLAMFLSGEFRFYHPQETCYQKIQKLPAASCITVGHGYVKEGSYWHIEDIKPVKYENDERYVEVLQELLEDAVKVRLRTDYPVASHLSGGIDSSTIAVIASRMLKTVQQKLFVFNWVRTDNEIAQKPEWGFAEELTQLEQMEKIPIRLHGEYLAELYDTVDIAKDDISFYWEEYLVRDEALNCNIRTILSGWGGDELISNGGYAYLSGLFYQGHFFKALKEIYAMFKYEGKNYLLLRTFKRALREILYPFFYRKMSGWYKYYTPEFDPFEYAQTDFAVYGKGLDFPKTVFYPGVHNEQKMLFSDGHILQRIEYWSASAFEKGIEYRYPLLDKRIVEFALGIPEELFAFRNGIRRHFFRTAISKFLPKHIAWETKISQKEHLKRWYKLWDDALRIWIEKNERQTTNRNSYMDRDKIIKHIKRYYSTDRKKVEKSVSGVVASILLSNLEVDD